MSEYNPQNITSTTGAENGSASASDLSAGHPFVRHLPDWFLPFALLSRWDRPIGVWLMLLPSLWGLAYTAPEYPEIADVILFFIGGWVMRGAGCTINDILDRNLDKQVSRTATRPLAAGTVSLASAIGWLIVQLLIGLIILCTYSDRTIIWGCIAVPLILSYPLLKRITWWPQLWLGITFNWGLWIGASVYVAPSDPAVWLFFIGCVCWTLGYDTIYAVQDKHDDARIGIKSTARLFGDNAPLFVYWMYAAALLLWLWASWVGYLSDNFYIGWLVAAMCAIWLLVKWKPGDMATARQAFVRNQYIGVAMLIAVLLGKMYG